MTETTARLDRTNLVLLTVSAVVFIFARFWRLTSACLWFDEIFSIHAARHSWHEIFQFAAADLIHPPLFYVLLKMWIAIGGESVFWVRLLPALLSIITIVPFLLLGRELRLAPIEATMSLLFVAVNGYLIKYAQEVRMYSLLFLLGTASLWLFFSLRNRPTGRRWITFGIVSFLLVYTHYAGWVLVFLQLIAIASANRRLLLRMLAVTAVVSLSYLPWIYLTVTTAHSGQGLGQNIGWVTRPGLAGVIEYIAILNRPFLFSQSSIDLVYNRLSALVALIVIGIPLAAFLWRRARTTERFHVILLVLFAFGPALLLLPLSWLLPYSLWGTRHLIVAAVPYSILVALALNSLRTYWIRTTLLLILGCWFFVAALIFVLRRPPEFIWCAWDGLAQQVPAIEGRRAQIYAFEDLVGYHVWFAVSNQTNPPKVTVVKNIPGLTEDTAYFLPRSFNDVSVLQNPRFDEAELWLAFRAERFHENAEPLKTFRSAGYQIDDVRTTKLPGQEAFLVKLERK